LVDFDVPEGLDAKPESRQRRVPRTVLLGLVVAAMLGPVGFDHQAVLQTGEVDDESADRHLPTEVEAGWSELAENNPELRLLPRHLLA
jgi:hypothetical protein